jgi:hypothetical protein
MIFPDDESDYKQFSVHCTVLLPACMGQLHVFFCTIGNNIQAISLSMHFICS